MEPGNPEIGIMEVVRELDLQREVDRGEYSQYFCDVHDGDTGDLTIYDRNHFVCFSDPNKSGGGAISLVMHVKRYNSVEQALEWCKEHFPEKDWEQVDEETVERRQQVQEVLNKAALWSYDALKKQHKSIYEELKEDRNFSDELMEEMQIGLMDEKVVERLRSRFDTDILVDSGLFYEFEDEDGSEKFLCQMKNRITFPYSRGEQVWYMIGRRSSKQESYWENRADEFENEIQQIIDNPDKNAESWKDAKWKWVSSKVPKYKKLNRTDFNKHIVYEWRDDRDQSDTVIVTEGVTDAISAHAAGYNVSSPVTTSYSDEDIERVCDRVKNFDTVYIIMDGDEEGWKGALKTAHEMARRGVEADLVQLEEGDLDDYTTENGYDISSLLDDSTLYLDILFEEIDEANRRTIAEKKRKLWNAIRGMEPEQRQVVFKEMPGSKRDNEKQFKNWLDEKQQQEERQRQMEKRSEDLNEARDRETETDSDVTSVLSTGDDEISINPSVKVHVNKLVATAVTKETNDEGVIDTEPVFKKFEIQFDEGDEQPTYYLLTKPYRNIELGVNFLPIKEADLDKERYKESEHFWEEYRSDKEEGESFSDWLKEQESDHLELAAQLSEESIQKVRSLSNDEILDLVREYQISSYHTDPKLRAVMYPQIVQHDKTQVDPGEIAPYQPHSQMWTNTKVGKSTTGGRIGRVVDDTTPAGLVGYADTDGKQEGTLDGLDESVYIDEFNFGASSQQLNDNLLGLMENGRYEQSKAGRRIITNFYGAINYMANPKESEESFGSDSTDPYGDETSGELISKFEELIQFLGYNIQAMGSRFGVILFDQEMDEAEKLKEENRIGRDRKSKLKTFMQWIVDEIRPKYTELEEELIDWLEQEYPESYRDEVLELAGNQIRNAPVKKFWKSHLHSYRHARGQALRMAVYQNIGKVLKDDYSVDEIREEADQAFEDVKTINLESLRNMTKVADGEATMQQARSLLEGEDAAYKELFVKTVVYHHQQNDVEIGRTKYRHVSEFKDTWSDLKEELDGLEKGDYYWKWSNLKNKVLDKRNQLGHALEQRYGIKLRNLQGEPMVSISKPENFQRFADLDMVSGEPLKTDSSGSYSTDLMSRVKEFIDSNGSAVSVQKVVESVDADEDRVESLIDKLKSEGDLYEPKPGKVDVI